jgi:hypothetical protein
MSKDLDDFLSKMMKDDYTTKARKEGTVSITSEDLINIRNRMKRETGHFLVIGASYLPDDCYGIFYLRHEDAEKLKADHKEKKAL